ncbi:MAG: lipopolysaccharide biosynthesis protein [Pseudobdellovibrionaceae bacterium]
MLNQLRSYAREHKEFTFHFLIVSFLNFLKPACSLIIAMLLVRSITTEQFGEYNFILSIIAIATATTLPGVENAITQSVARGHPGTYRYLLKLSFLTTFIGAAGIFLTGVALHFFSDKGNLTAFAIAACFFPFYLGLEQWKALRKGMEDFKKIVTISSTVQFVQLAIVAGGIFLFPGEYIIILFLYFLTPAIRNITQTIWALRFTAKDHEKFEPETKKYGLVTSLYALYNLVANNVDKILIYFFISPESLAILVIAEKIPELIRQVIGTYTNVLAPKLARIEKYSLELEKKIRLFSWIIAGGILAVAFLILPWFIPMAFTDKYQDSVLVAQLLCVSVAIGNVATLRYFFIKSRLDAVSEKRITLTTSMIRIVASCVCVPFFGLWGVIISVFVYRLSTVFMVRRVIKDTYLKES